MPAGQHSLSSTDEATIVFVTDHGKRGMPDNPGFEPAWEGDIEPGSFIARSWHDLDLLRHIFSDDPDTVSAAKTELERRRLVREALSARFRERQIAEHLQWQRYETEQRRRRHIWILLSVSGVLAATLTITLLFFAY